MKPRVLVVEDDPVTRAYFEDVLAAAGLAADAAADCAGALARAGPGRHSLWLVDAQLPDGDAFSLLPRLRDAGGPVVAIGHTASRDRALHEALRAAGCAEVLVKPLAVSTLLAAVRAHAHGLRAEAAWDDAGATRALGGVAHVRELRALYLEELPGALARVAAAVQGDDADGARAALHRLAASSALAGARPVADAVRRLHEAPLDREALAALMRAARALGAL